MPGERHCSLATVLSWVYLSWARPASFWVWHTLIGTLLLRITAPLVVGSHLYGEVMNLTDNLTGRYVCSSQSFPETPQGQWGRKCLTWDLILGLWFRSLCSFHVTVLGTLCLLLALLLALPCQACCSRIHVYRVPELTFLSWPSPYFEYPRGHDKLGPTHLLQDWVLASHIPSFNDLASTSNIHSVLLLGSIIS